LRNRGACSEGRKHNQGTLTGVLGTGKKLKEQKPLRTRSLQRKDITKTARGGGGGGVMTCGMVKNNRNERKNRKKVFFVLKGKDKKTSKPGKCIKGKNVKENYSQT